MKNRGNNLHRRREMQIFVRVCVCLLVLHFFAPNRTFFRREIHNVLENSQLRRKSTNIHAAIPSKLTYFAGVPDDTPTNYEWLWRPRLCMRGAEECAKAKVGFRNSVSLDAF